MTGSHLYPSGVSNHVDSNRRTFVDVVESIGSPSDDATSDVTEPNSAFSLAKGILSGLGVGAGAGTANSGNVLRGAPVSLERALGNPNDAPATDDSAWSAISLLKGILAQAGI